MTGISKMSESMWAVKPWWCQPWSIVLTGLTGSAGSWFLLHRLWITLPVTSVILVWWLLFLVIVPAQYAAAVQGAEREGAQREEAQREEASARKD